MFSLSLFHVFLKLAVTNRPRQNGHEMPDTWSTPYINQTSKSRTLHHLVYIGQKAGHWIGSIIHRSKCRTLGQIYITQKQDLGSNSNPYISQSAGYWVKLHQWKRKTLDQTQSPYISVKVQDVGPNSKSIHQWKRKTLDQNQSPHISQKAVHTSVKKQTLGSATHQSHYD